MEFKQFNGSTSEFLSLGDGILVKKPMKVWEGNANRESLEKEFENALSIERKLLEHLGSHPRIVPYLGPYDQFGIKLAEASNGNLQIYINRFNHEIDTPLRWTWLLQLAESVAFIHSKDIIHSDLRPDNWLVNSEKSIWLCDFGGSACDKLGLDGGHLPDDPFYDPQLIESTAALDIFSLGSTFYVVMTGHWPFCTGLPPVGDERWAYVERVTCLFKSGQFPDVSGVPASKVIQGCWHHTYKTAAEVVEAVKLEMANMG